MTRHGFETFPHEGWQDHAPLAAQGGIKLSCRLTIFLFGTLTEARRHGGGVVATAVLCRLGVARECRKMNANRKGRLAERTKDSGAKAPNPTNQNLPQSRRDAEEGVIETPRISAD